MHSSPARSALTSRVDVSVIVPTFNRRDRLIRLLRALDAQNLTASSGRRFALEVIVVSDGSTDGTIEAVRDLAANVDLSISYHEQDNSGPAAARNRGIREASGNVVLFIDDDVVPEPDCVARHVDRHDREPNLVVIGPMLTPAGAGLSPWVAWEQHQLEKQYDWFAAHSEHADHVHFYTGNASVERAALLAAGGFDTSFSRAEDIELAYRLGEAGQSFVVELSARAHHYAERSFDSWLQTAYDYGQTSVRFAQMGRSEFWDRIRSSFRERNPLLRVFTLALFPHRRLSRVVSWLFVRLAIVAERLGLDAASRSLLSGVYSLANARGAADAMGSPSAYVRLVRQSPPFGDKFVCLFVLEQTLGHVTHSKNLQTLIPDVDDMAPVFLPIDPGGRGIWSLPGLTNWTVRAGLRARGALRRTSSTQLGRQARAMFVHSQVPAVLLGGWMRRIPTVLSIDATPKQYDAFGEYYSHDVGPRAIERLKTWANVRCFEHAVHVVTWSNWAKIGLIDEYGIEPTRITVIPPGVEIERWARSEKRAPHDGPLRVLFVGGDLQRKGGDLLISATRLLRTDPEVPAFEVHLVTNTSVTAEPGVVVHHGLSANSPELIDQYHRADIFCLPTLGDCLPVVLAEAAASGLPLIATDVGAISELVRDGQTGRLIRPGQLDDLVAALRAMLISEDERMGLGRATLDLALEEHDARRNALRIIALLRAAAAPGSIQN